MSSNDDTRAKEKVTRKTVTETIEKSGGVQTKTTTISCSENDLDKAFRKLDLDPEKFRSGGTKITRQIVYTNSDGNRKVLEETVETFGESTEEQKPTLKNVSCGKEKVVPKHTSSSNSAEISNQKKNEAVFDPKGFEEDCLRAHNIYRAKHGVPALKLSEELCRYSREWAEHLAQTDSFEHRSDRKYGENIFMKWSSNSSHAVAGDEAVKSWYSEIKDYEFGREPKTLKSGHFTQVVWRDSNLLGVACSRSSSGKVLVVANYDPPGNFISHFAKNVPPPTN